MVDIYKCSLIIGIIIIRERETKACHSEAGSFYFQFKDEEIVAQSSSHASKSWSVDSKPWASPVTLP